MTKRKPDPKLEIWHWEKIKIWFSNPIFKKLLPLPVNSRSYALKFIGLIFEAKVASNPFNHIWISTLQ